MDVNSVNRPAVQAAPAPKRTAEVRPEPERENKPQESQARSDVPPPPKPVVNAQGQLTGRTLNVTA
jgi:hypothetical protein